MQPETSFKVKVKRVLDEIPELWYEKIQQVAIRGTPDFLICYKGNFVAWELKVAPNGASKLQQYTLDKIKESGGVAVLVYPETLNHHLRELLAMPKV